MPFIYVGKKQDCARITDTICMQVLKSDNTFMRSKKMISKSTVDDGLISRKPSSASYTPSASVTSLHTNPSFLKEGIYMYLFICVYR
jgi:UDP-glucose 6-dehydrogenase